MHTFIIRHSPKNKEVWKRYFRVFLPIIISSTIIALNGMIDNFMVGHIPQGISALAAVNSWTNIFTGFTLATAAAGSVALAQFYHAKNFKVVKQIARFRYLINICMSIILFILVYTARNWMINIFMSKPEKNATSDEIINYNTALDNATTYIKITAFQWLLFSVSYDIGSQLREIGHARITLVAAMIMLCYHISLNAIFLYGLNFGIRGAAIVGATSRLIPITLLTFYIIRKKLEIAILPWTLFKISKQAVILMLKRWIYFLSVFTVTFFITFRNHFYDLGYPTSSNSLGQGVSGLAVLGLTGSIMNIFTTTFAAAPAMAANFVASELGKGNIEQAKINSDEIKGFNTIVASLLAVLLVLFSLIIPYMTFLISAGEGTSAKQTDAKSLLSQVSHATLTIAFWYPIWIWFVSGYRNSQAGGKGGFMAIWDWFVSGLQLGWLALLVYQVLPQSLYFRENFWATYFVFFVSDLLKLIGMEAYYYRYGWLFSLTHDEVNVHHEHHHEHPKAEKAFLTDKNAVEVTKEGEQNG